MKSYQHYSTYQIGIIKARAHRTFSDVLAKSLVTYDLTVTEWTVLGVINDRPGVTFVEIAELLNTKASHPTQVVTGLQQRKLITRKVSKEDGRVKRLTLTPKGKELVRRAEPEVRRDVRTFLGDVPRDQLQTYFEVLQRFGS